VAASCEHGNELSGSITGRDRASERSTGMVG
jgi:hypothetical protein